MKQSYYIFLYVISIFIKYERIIYRMDAVRQPGPIYALSGVYE